MGGKNRPLASFALAGTKKGKVLVSHLDEPYGVDSHSVVSIGISLKGNMEEPDWKAHIPYENIQELIDALELAKSQHNQ